MKDKIKQFQYCKVGDLIRVEDVDLLIELNGKTPDFIIRQKRTYIEYPSHYIVLDLNHIGTEYTYVLVCSIFNDVCDVNLYAEPDFYTPDTRKVLTDKMGWLFDGEGYPTEIYSGDDTFIKKQNQQEYFGDSCVVEWETESKIINYKILVIEDGTNNDNGGWVEFLEGRQIKDTEITF